MSRNRRISSGGEINFSLLQVDHERWWLTNRQHDASVSVGPVFYSFVYDETGKFGEKTGGLYHILFSTLIDLATVSYH